MTLLQSAHSLLKYNLDYILIGDTAINYAKQLHSIDDLSPSFQTSAIIFFDKSYEQLIFKQHTSRLDAPENVIRSSILD